MIRRGVALAALIVAMGVTEASAETLVPISPSTYAAPTFVTSDPTDPDRLFVTDQSGSLWVVSPAGKTLFLDLDDKVLSEGEHGLWSIAFAPDFATSGLFYLAYSDADDGDIRLSEFHEEATPALTEATLRPILESRTMPRLRATTPASCNSAPTVTSTGRSAMTRTAPMPRR